jgi:hypothetical protein
MKFNDNHKTKKPSLSALVVALGASMLIVACGGGGGGGADAGGGGTTPSAWQVAQLLEATNDQAGNADVAINASGVAYAVWTQNIANGVAVMSSRYINGQWETPLQVSGRLNLLDPVPEANVAVDADGIATVIWVQRNVDKNTIVSSRTDANGQWVFQGEHQSVDPNTGVQRDLELASDNQGNSLAVWRLEQGIFSVYLPKAGAPGPAEQVSMSTQGQALSPSVAMHADGDALVVWSETIGGETVSLVRPYDNGVRGGEFNFTGVLTNVDSFNPQVAIGANGQAVVTWTEERAGNATKVIQARAAVNAMASQWEVKKAVAIGNVGAAKPAIDSQGRAVALWRELGAQQFFDIRASRFDGNDWFSAGIIEFDTAGNAGAPEVGMDATGRAIAVWEQNDGVRLNITSSRMDPATGVWSVPERIESEDRGSAGFPSLAVSLGGRAVAAWGQKNGTLTGPGGAEVESVMANVFK